MSYRIKTSLEDRQEKQLATGLIVGGLALTLATLVAVMFAVRTHRDTDDPSRTPDRTAQIIHVR